ncbi:hypothetical protein [Streptomyces goshikiensis]|uniref:hypothetical protein n=1 Tax=Streptomyces goshikiensis TaxID=1942 RepID=UPI00367CA5A2
MIQASVVALARSRSPVSAPPVQPARTRVITPLSGSGSHAAASSGGSRGIRASRAAAPATARTRTCPTARTAAGSAVPPLAAGELPALLEHHPGARAVVAVSHGSSLATAR